ncbi:putative auxin efflux carrier [Zymomonas mobilis subsp. mobilis ZM4 = ATCC 31821]|uniref:Auxin Efflux Carrier n=1 Tax=Zymomonas mobilis subsp. mobilis (strain ATCC 31821 / ZM4 / CP4) TaxID=264203 RepID=Q5NPP8_ZYMMO|nr:AEC family transporter [Zymomonas mobilis]AAV89312.2 Auxin Efflux Carrier [Zymomonas mobilis subsp. mobilis ZM4 = ATCC 31821]AVZ25638.1 putative auxin efflux carrier [Zymomonas mobilis subsp. mobilis]AVZ27529.1 putative auxin efflux carrier [Zymomonas mobilis subsp. mobilis]AVZ41975.1 putative auxin efflux carrier [Zymomonas mobilis subsp. mobilis ZM4 = ATCC 31821]UBQ08447.1 AEC family transporter [Zymomonas mobilis]
MLEVIISALLPIIITLMIGFFAGWRGEFTANQASTLNKMVLRYALPMTLFSGILSLPKTQILSSGSAAIILLLAMAGGYLITLGIGYFVCQRPVNESALLALSVSAPAVPFVGITVLGHLFGTASTILVSICSLMMNLVQVPVTIFLLSAYSPKKNTDKIATDSSFFSHIRHAFTEPIVIAPILALICVSLSIPFPETLKSSLMLLGKATGGVALFSSGIILFSRKVILSKTVASLVLSKNIIIPTAVLVLASINKTPPLIIEQTTITMAIPSAAITTMLAIRYQLMEQDMASTLFFSTILSIISMGGFILLTAI